MDPQSPIRNQRISADWGRAVADAIRAGRLEGDGTFRSPVGSSVAPAQPPAVPMRPPRPPFCTAFTAKTEEGEAVQGLTVRPGHVWWVADNATTEVPYVGTDGDFDTLGTGDGFEGETWADYDLPEGDFYVYASVAFSSGAPTSWTLKAGASLTPATGRRNYPVALVTRVGDYGGLSVEQLRLGEFILGAGSAGGSGGGSGEGEGEGEGEGTSPGGGAEHWGTTGSLDIQGWTTGPNAVAASGTRIALPGVTVAAGSGGAGGVAATLTPTTRHFSVDTMGNVREIAAPTSGTAVQILNGSNGANGQDATPWGTRSSTAFNNALDGSTPDTGGEYDVMGNGAGRLVHLSGTWLKIPTGTPSPGGEAFRFRELKVDFQVDSKGNVQRLNKTATPTTTIAGGWQQVLYPLGAKPGANDAFFNLAADSTSSQAGTSYDVRANGQKKVHLSSSWISVDGNTLTYAQQKVDVHIDQFGAICEVDRGSKTTGTWSRVGTTGKTIDLVVSGFPTIDFNSNTNTVHVVVPTWTLEIRNGLIADVWANSTIEKYISPSYPT